MMKINQVLILLTRNHNLVDNNMCSCSEEVSPIIFITHNFMHIEVKENMQYSGSHN